MPSCKQCSAEFNIQPKERELLAKISSAFRSKEAALPEPTECPDCRRQHRLMFRNFFNLYHRECDLTGKKIISMYDKDAPFPVYEMHEWWSDKWDGLQYGKDVDAEGTFFEQLQQLHLSVPRMSIVNSQSENTDYCNMSFQSKNCYLVFGNVGNEDCAYGHIVWQSQNCYDCLYTYKSAFCYECIDCVQCHSLRYSRDCDNCSDSSFLVHCVSCKNCFGCVGLHQKEYHIFNQPYSREEYEKRIAELNLGNRSNVELARAQVEQLYGKEIVKYYHGFNCENVVGDYLYNCRNIIEGYDLKNCEDCMYVATVESFSDSLDCNFSPAKSQLCYQCIAVDGYHLLGCHNCTAQCAELSYCDNCYSCKNCFGCVGLKSKQYCILNKQYSKEEYESLVLRIIEAMTKNGEWGQFLPHAFSPFGYNETIAQEYFPLTKSDLSERRWKWKEEENESEQYLGPSTELPEDIRDADESIYSQILRCKTSGKLYKIIPQELAFYKQMNIPLPEECFMQRQKRRFALRNPRHLWARTCMKCKKDIQTTYAPQRPELVHCEECYLSAVY